jgi:hypothetical protein
VVCRDKVIVVDGIVVIMEPPVLAVEVKVE